MCYIILEYVKIEKEKELPVILIDSLGEILTFTSKIEAKSYLSSFETISKDTRRFEIKNINATQESSCNGCGGCCS